MVVAFFVSANAMLKIVVLISGRGSNLEALARSIKRGDMPAQIVGVISDNSDALGLQVSEHFGIPTAVVERRKDEISLEQFFKNLIETVDRFNPDLIVLAGFMRIVPEELINRYRWKMINVHPSVLPSFRGLNAQKQALEAGVSFTGCTVHFVEPEVDSGPIIAQAIVPIFPGDDLSSLTSRILEEEHGLLPFVVKAIAEGRVIIEKTDDGDKIKILGGE